MLRKKLTKVDSDKRRIGHFFMAIDISKFIDLNIFKKNLQEMADRIRRMEPLNDYEKVMVAGDPEKLTAARRSKEGIPVDDVKADEFFEVSPEFKKALKT